jgi:hypothetical protein
MRTITKTIIFSLAGIIIAMILGSAYKYKFRTEETISVTGMSEFNFVSDLIVWRGSFSKHSSDIKIAYQQLKEDEAKIKKYLVSKGVAENEIVFSSINIQKEFKDLFDNEGRVRGSEFTGYMLSQTVKVESKKIDIVEKVSREITELIESGIEFNSAEPLYYYTKLSSLKIDLLAKASADAKQRAETITQNSGCSLGSLKKASMGIFQITGQNMDEDYSYGGAFNVTSKNKTATITIRMEFEVN